MSKSLKSIFLGFVVFFLGTFSVHGQQIDSLRLDTLINVLTLQLEDERTVNAYTELSHDYVEITDFETGLKYAELGLELSEKIGYKRGQLESSASAAHIYLAYRLDYAKSMKLFDQAYNLAKELDLDDQKIRVYRGYTSIYSSLEDYEAALSYNSLAIELAEKIGDKQVVSDLNAYGGNIYEETGDTVTALQMYEKVVDIETENNFKNTSKASLIVVARYYQLKGDVEKSLKQYRIALKRFERLQDLRWVAYTHSEMAKIYMDQENLERAELHGLEGYTIAEDLNLTKAKIDNSNILAELYMKQNRDSLANFYQFKYDSLMSITVVEVSSDVAIPEGDTENASKSSKDNASPLDGILNTIIILGLVGLAVFITGFKKSTKK